MTHKPLRSQSGNLRVAEQQTQTSARVAVSDERIAYPNSYTPERAITVFKNLMEVTDSAELRNLYKWTVDTLVKVSKKTVDSEGKV